MESWVIAIAMVGYPLVSSMSQIIGMDNRILSIWMRFSLLVICAVLLLTAHGRNLSRANVFFWICWWSFWTLYLARMGFDSFFATRSFSLPLSEYWTFAIGVSLIPAVSLACGHLRIAMQKAFALLSWWMPLTVFLHLFVLWRQGRMEEITSARAETEVMDPISLGHLGASLFIIALWQLSGPKPRPASGLLKSYVSVLLALTMMLVGASKGPVLALLAVVSICLLLRPKRFLNIHFFVLLLCGILGVVFYSKALLSSFLFERLSSGIFSDGVRQDLVSNGLRLIGSSPIIGAGIEPLETYPHNLVLESFLAGGVLTGSHFVDC